MTVTAPALVGTSMQIAGLLIAGWVLGATYKKYAKKGTFKRTFRAAYWWVRERVQRGWKHPVRAQASYMSGYGAEKDLRSYDLPTDTHDALELLAEYIKADHATLAETKALAGHTAARVDGIDTNQADVVERGVREYALDGILFAMVGLALNIVGLAVTLI